MPLRIIPEHKRSDILRIVVANVLTLDREAVLFTTHLPGYKRAYLDLDQLNPTCKEEYVIKDVRLYLLKDFVEDYNTGRPKGVGNTSLSLLDGRLVLKADDEKIEVTNQSLRTYQGSVVLDAVVPGIGAVKIRKNLDGVEFRLGDHSLATSIAVTEDHLVTTYLRTEDGPFHKRIRPIKKGAEVQITTKESKVLLRGSFIIQSRVRGSEDIFHLEASPEAFESVNLILKDAKTIDQYRKAKGDLGEKIAVQLFKSLGMKLVADHPKNKDHWRKNSSRTGPDFLVEDVTTGEWLYVEAKWWDNGDDAFETAKLQAMADLARFAECFGRRVAGSMVVVLDWKQGREILLRIGTIRSYG